MYLATLLYESAIAGPAALTTTTAKQFLKSRRDDAGFQDVLDTIEEVVTAAQGLQAVSITMKELKDLANSNRRTTVSLTDVEAAAAKRCFCLYYLQRFV
ncbi:hypothetical protein G5714_004618 [Onychostoma macrolepis]|uniref:Uncharacterized protein n=1 Tax=Onychostoma macrolepis TaxID=369639 RepID=A0A7J6D5P7_9TELE|nr:hypothetical protein G5714_004618 [Onychostoma macrolepis]